MDPLLASLRHAGTELLGLTLCLALVLVLRLALPAERRRLVRGPVLLLALHLAAYLAERVMPPGGWARGLEVASLALLLAAFARAGVLLVFEVVVGRRLELPKIIRDIVQAVAYLAVAMVVLRSVGMDPGSLLTTSALLTAVVGLSLQETLGNLFAGLAIQLQRPFEVGDWIGFDPDPKLTGRVLEINWRATKLCTLDEVEVVVPNGALAKAAIRNYSKPTKVNRRSVFVLCPYDTPPHVVRRTILEALAELPDVCEVPAPSVVTNDFAASGIEYWVRFYTEAYHRRDTVDSAARDRIWYALARAGVVIPLPQRTVHLRELSAATLEADEERRLVARERALRGMELFRELPEGAHRGLAAITEQRCYAPGEIIVREGDRVDELYLVQTGEVLVLLDLPGDDNDVEIERLGPGDFFGEIDLSPGDRSYATVKAVGACELLVLGHRGLQQVLRGSPELAERIGAVLADRAARLEHHAATLPDDDDDDPVARRDHFVARIRQFFSL